MKTLSHLYFRRGHAGVTLLEILAVLAIFAILVTMGAPALNGFISRAKRRAVLDGLGMDIQYARMMAVRQGRPTRLVFDPAATSACTPPTGYASYSGYRVVLSEAGRERTLKVVDLSDAGGVCLQMNNVGSPFAFNSRGMLTPFSQRTVRVESGGGQDALTVINMTGRVLPSY